jgi:hypothetical protein
MKIQIITNPYNLTPNPSFFKNYTKTASKNQGTIRGLLALDYHPLITKRIYRAEIDGRLILKHVNLVSKNGMS